LLWHFYETVDTKKILSFYPGPVMPPTCRIADSQKAHGNLGHWTDCRFKMTMTLSRDHWSKLEPNLK